jgi:hypothetical protein
LSVPYSIATNTRSNRPRRTSELLDVEVGLVVAEVDDDDDTVTDEFMERLLQSVTIQMDVLSPFPSVGSDVGDGSDFGTASTSQSSSPVFEPPLGIPLSAAELAKDDDLSVFENLDRFRKSLDENVIVEEH